MSFKKLEISDYIKDIPMKFLNNFKPFPSSAFLNSKVIVDKLSEENLNYDFSVERIALEDAEYQRKNVLKEAEQKLKELELSTKIIGSNDKPLKKPIEDVINSSKPIQLTNISTPTYSIANDKINYNNSYQQNFNQSSSLNDNYVSVQPINFNQQNSKNNFESYSSESLILPSSSQNNYVPTSLTQGINYNYNPFTNNTTNYSTNTAMNVLPKNYQTEQFNYLNNPQINIAHNNKNQNLSTNQMNGLNENKKTQNFLPSSTNPFINDILKPEQSNLAKNNEDNSISKNFKVDKNDNNILSTKTKKIDVADFEDSSSPFDDALLRSIDEKEELNNVFQQFYCNGSNNLK